MIKELDQAYHQSMDPPSMPPPSLTHRQQTGRAGRPRIEIDPVFLATALTHRGPGLIGRVAGCSSRTVRRRALEQQLVEPGTPVFAQHVQPDGEIARIHTSTAAPTSNLSDEELDALVSSTLQAFPQFGRSMLRGSLKAAGHRVPTQRIHDSYLRVHGAPGVFGQRAIHRKNYSVPGANSLWHHDGQHGSQTFIHIFFLLSLILI